MLSWSFTDRLCYCTLHFTCEHMHLTCSENGTIVRKKLLTLCPIKTTFGKKGKELKTLLNHSEWGTLLILNKNSILNKISRARFSIKPRWKEPPWGKKTNCCPFKSPFSLHPLAAALMDCRRTWSLFLFPVHTHFSLCLSLVEWKIFYKSLSFSLFSLRNASALGAGFILSPSSPFSHSLLHTGCKTPLHILVPPDGRIHFFSTWLWILMTTHSPTHFPAHINISSVLFRAGTALPSRIFWQGISYGTGNMSLINSQLSSKYCFSNFSRSIFKYTNILTAARVAVDILAPSPVSLARAFVFISFISLYKPPRLARMVHWYVSQEWQNFPLRFRASPVHFTPTRKHWHPVPSHTRFFPVGKRRKSITERDQCLWLDCCISLFAEVTGFKDCHGGRRRTHCWMPHPWGKSSTPVSRR